MQKRQKTNEKSSGSGEKSTKKRGTLDLKRGTLGELYSG